LTARPPVRLTAQVLTPWDSAFHVLNRLAYGPRPGEADSVVRFGAMRWIDQQLDPRHIDNPVLAERERQFQLLDLSRGEPGADLPGRAAREAGAPPRR
jgi:hypothetical protein